MSIDEVIRILNRKTTIPDSETSWIDIENAFGMAISALRAQHTTLDRSRWPGCDNCTAGDGEFRYLLEKWGGGLPRPRWGQNQPACDPANHDTDAGIGGQSG